MPIGFFVPMHQGSIGRAGCVLLGFTGAALIDIQMLHSVLMAANLLALSYYGHAQYNRKARNVHMLLGAVWIGGAMTSCWHFLLPKKVKITWEESFNLCMPVFTQPSLRLVYPLVFLLAALHCTAPQGLGIVGVFV